MLKEQLAAMCMGADTMYLNRPSNVEFLDERLSIKNNTHILQQNLFIILLLLEIIAVSRLLSILRVSIVIPIR